MPTITLGPKTGDDEYDLGTSFTEGDLPLTEGTIAIGNASGVGTELDIGATNAGVIIGNGTTGTVAALSGDVTMTNGGVTSVDALDLETATVTNIGDTEVLIGTGAGTAAFAALSGDVTMDNTGAVTIAAGAVDNAMLSVPKLVVYQETCPVASFTDGGGAVGTFALTHTIPAGAVFKQCTIHSLVGFAGDTTAVLTVGDGSDVDRYNTGTPDVFTTAAAGVDMGAPSGTAFHATAVSTVTLTITGTADFTSIVTEGNGTVIVSLWYYQPV